MPAIRVKQAPMDATTAAVPARRGSKPGVKRGSYKPRRIDMPEPTAEQMERRCREYWGELYDAGARVIHHRTHKPVSVRSYLPPDSLFSPDHPSYQRLPPDGWKTCRACGVDLELAEFSANGRGGLKSNCMSCLAEKARDYFRTPEGKAARLRAQAQYLASLKAEEQRTKSKAALIAVASKTARGRMLLAQIGLMPSVADETTTPSSD